MMRFVYGKQLGGPLTKGLAFEDWDCSLNGGSYTTGRDFFSVHWEVHDHDPRGIRLHVEAPRAHVDPELNDLKAAIIEMLLRADIGHYATKHGLDFELGRLVSAGNIRANKSTEPFRIIVPHTWIDDGHEANIQRVHGELADAILQVIQPFAPRLANAFSLRQGRKGQAKGQEASLKENPKTMQLIRLPSYTGQQARLYGWGTLALLAGVFILSLLNRTLASIPLLLACLLGLQYAREVIAPRAERWIGGYMGEQRVLKELRDLPDTYTAITNYVAPGAKRGDIDLILVGPMGILAIEIKSYEGCIVYENGRWWKRQPNGWKTRLKNNPSAQARGHRKALIDLFKQQQSPALRDLFAPVMPVLVFVGTDGLETEGLSMKALRVRELKEYICHLPSKLTQAQVTAVIELLVPTPGIVADRA